jgi:FKBP-type peptidyl-prolyl cis-trans isomerase FkpA
MLRNLFYTTTLLLFAAQMAFAQAKTTVKTEHGFRFINHTNKKGAKPQHGDMVLVSVSTFIGDSMVMSTARMGGPREFPMYAKDQVPQRVPFVFDGALLMSKGDSVTMYEIIDSALMKRIPEELRKGVTEIRYEMVLNDITTAEELAKQQAEALKAIAATQQRFPQVKQDVEAMIAKYTSGAVQDLTVTPSGLKILIVDKGTGAPAKKGENVQTHYFGALTTGKAFDNSFERGEPLPFALGVGQMIPGFDEGAGMLNHGGKAYLFIPPTLGYGEQGAGEMIPPNSELVFYIELL